MHMKKSLILSLLLALSSFSASAESTQGAAGSGPNPFSDCGIGAALFPDVHWAAITSNVIWDLGTTGVTSATASPETCSGSNAQAALFINDTYEQLAEETARGEGEHLSSVMNIMECDASRHGAAISMTREAMAGVVADPAYATQSHQQKASQFYTIIESAVSKSCSA